MEKVRDCRYEFSCVEFFGPVRYDEFCAASSDLLHVRSFVQFSSDAWKVEVFGMCVLPRLVQSAGLSSTIAMVCQLQDHRFPVISKPPPRAHSQVQAHASHTSTISLGGCWPAHDTRTCLPYPSPYIALWPFRVCSCSLSFSFSSLCVCLAAVLSFHSIVH